MQRKYVLFGRRPEVRECCDHCQKYVSVETGARSTCLLLGGIELITLEVLAKSWKFKNSFVKVI